MKKQHLQMDTKDTVPVGGLEVDTPVGKPPSKVSPTTAKPLGAAKVLGVPSELPKNADVSPPLTTNWMPVTALSLVRTLMAVTYSPGGTSKAPK